MKQQDADRINAALNVVMKDHRDLVQKVNRLESILAVKEQEISQLNVRLNQLLVSVFNGGSTR